MKREMWYLRYFDMKYEFARIQKLSVHAITQKTFEWLKNENDI